MLRATLLLPPLLLAACDPGCDAADHLDPGELVAVVDGVDWAAASAGWQVTATGLQVSTTQVAGWRINMVGQTAGNGDDVVSRFEAEDMPLYIPLGSSLDGGWGLLYPDDGSTYATEAADGGFLRLSRARDAELYGCFRFEASDGRDVVDVREGSFRLAEFDTQ